MPFFLTRPLRSFVLPRPLHLAVSSSALLGLGAVLWLGGATLGQAQNPAPAASAARTASAAAANTPVVTVPGMPPVVDKNNLYSETVSGRISPATAGALERVYVPNRGANTVSVIDPATLKGHRSPLKSCR